MVAEFHWIPPQLLAGSGQPGYMNDEREDMDFLKAAGINLIVSLTEDPLPFDAKAYGFETLHFPIPDMHVPQSPAQTEKLCKRIDQALAQKQGVLLHCKHGTGRTGTLLACVLILQGRSANEALLEIRKVLSYYVANSLQERFLQSFASYCEIKREYQTN